MCFAWLECGNQNCFNEKMLQRLNLGMPGVLITKGRAVACRLFRRDFFSHLQKQ